MVHLFEELLMILHYCRWYLRLHLRQLVELLHLRQLVELLHLRQLVELLHLRQLVVEELHIDLYLDLVLQEGYILQLELLMILHYCRWYLRLHLRQLVELLHLRQLVELLHLRQLVVEELHIDLYLDLVLQEGYILQLELLMILHYCRWYLRLHLRQLVELLHLRQLVELLTFISWWSCCTFVSWLLRSFTLICIWI